MNLLFFLLKTRTDLKLHNVPVMSKTVKKVMINLDSSKASDPDCTPVVVQINCYLSYILSDLINMRLKESCFPGC